MFVKDAQDEVTRMMVLPRTQLLTYDLPNVEVHIAPPGLVVFHTTESLPNVQLGSLGCNCSSLLGIAGLKVEGWGFEFRVEG